jgi:peptidoglycan hydrolase-like protein with peptidoglycan-binding domain
MRFAEFKLLEAKQQLFAIGDSHAAAIGSQAGWNNLAKNGRRAEDPANDAAIAKVPNGSLVVLSAGANNMLDPNKTAVVGRIESLINKLKQKQCTVYYVLFASTDHPKFAKDRNQLRELVKNAIGTEVGVLDMGSLKYKEGSSDGIHAPMSWYIQAARTAATGAKEVAPQSGQGAKQDTSGQGEAAVNIIAVPNSRVGPAIADIQKVLLALGYKLPKHGVDGVRGPETSAAVSAFQEDNNLAIDGDPGPQTVGMLNKLVTDKQIKFVKSTQADVKGKMSGVTDIDDEDVVKYNDIPQDEMTKKAREAAESYLGRDMSDNEWDYLLRATFAESAYDVKSYAMVMGTILNHTRQYAPGAKNGVIVALRRPNAFQAVTGTRANKHDSSPGFKSGPPAKHLRAISTGAIQYLDKVPRNQMEFSATNPAAYGPGTNIGWLRQLEKQKTSSVHAGSRFNTTLQV